MEASTPDAAARRALAGMAHLWWLWLVFGIFWIVVALSILQFDKASITTVGVLIGAMFLASGCQQLALAGPVEGAPRWIRLRARSRRQHHRGREPPPPVAGMRGESRVACALG